MWSRELLLQLAAGLFPPTAPVFTTGELWVTVHVVIYGNSIVIRNDPNDDFSLNL
ncbi:hypothetical protein SLEP1_g6820 [Rubroshorea leprosula]|uniref:Uncharacterized protein n=1 Tax=Rubroshorea leprosula TaxID=152421 RepID=A0AAV5I4Q6_9ROSI|nr:hypothetical protein SLEP1_g6820 [Rubroshorea leprosula]